MVLIVLRLDVLLSGFINGLCVACAFCCVVYFVWISFPGFVFGFEFDLSLRL